MTRYEQIRPDLSNLIIRLDLFNRDHIPHISLSHVYLSVLTWINLRNQEDQDQIINHQHHTKQNYLFIPSPVLDRNHRINIS